MKKIYQYNNILYKGNVNRDFYLFNLKRNFKLIKYIFKNILNLIISLIIFSKKDLYVKKKFMYLKDIENLEEKIVLFYKCKNRYNNYIDIEKKEGTIIEKTPKILLKCDGINNIIGYELNKNYEINIEKYYKEINEIETADDLYIKNQFQLYSIKSDRIFIVHNNRLKYLEKRIKRIKKLEKFIFIALISFILTCISFCYTNYILDLDMFFTYFEIKLFLLNYIPILLLILLIYFISKRIHMSFLITSLFIMVLGIANQTKLLYRDDVVKFEDITVFKEAMTMSKRYDVVIRWYTIVLIILLVILFLIMRRFIGKSKIKIRKQLVGIITFILMFICSYKLVFSNSNIYNLVGDTSSINVWISTRQSQIRGLVYPFINSIGEVTITKPENYNKNDAIEILKKYEYKNIDNDKKVNIISIMLESYNDFSKYDNIEIDSSVYQKLHAIENESISGNLVTNIFGGGTIVTERGFLTGYNSFPSYRKKTNSYVWYFKEQGYKTEAMHPIYGAFYNRASVDPNLGFDIYYNYENKFSNIKKEFLKDYEFFDYIIEGYEKSKKENMPYFNFSVTYQNHGPYSSEVYEGKEYYVKNNNYSNETYNTFNEYISGIKKTGDALEKLIKYFDNEQEPVIVIFFGDHNPYLGEEGYDDLNIDLDLSNISGFENYYETPYVIHANSSAKKMFNKEFKGKGNKISPIFLMNELFNYCGLEGNEYLQYMSDLKSNIDVINKYYFKENGKYITKENLKNKKLIDQYNNVNYYYSRNYESK